MDLNELNRYKKDEERKQLDEKIEKGEIEDKELEEIKRQTAEAQKETVKSSARALEILRSTQETADQTAKKLEEQGEQIERIGGKAGEMTEKAAEAYGETQTLEKKTKLFGGLMPSFGAKKKKKEEEKKKEESKKEKSKKEEQSRVYVEGEEGELEKNVDDISSGLDALLASGKAMGDTMTGQSQKIETIQQQTVEATENIKKSTKTLDKI